MHFFNKRITSDSAAPHDGVTVWHTRSWIWVALAIFTILIQRWIPVSLVEDRYYRGLFQWIRRFFDFFLGWSPVPVLYIILCLILIRVVFWIRDWHKGWRSQLIRAAGGISALIVLFYWLWGFNYGQVSLQDRLGYDLQGVDQEAVEAEFRQATIELIEAVGNLPKERLDDEMIQSYPVRDADLRPHVRTALDHLGLPSMGEVRVRQLWPKGILLRWSTAGIYIPQTGEGHIDKGLLSIQKPFTIAHEMAHGYGVTDEGACNFIAWLACRHAEHPWVQFGGALAYWRYVAAEMPVDSVMAVKTELPDIVLRALTLIRENNNRYPDLMPVIRDAVYSSYLRRHGMKEGLRTYNFVVKMVCHYRRNESYRNGSD